jgi:phosphoribosylglycinamide formyltransferase-1
MKTAVFTSCSLRHRAFAWMCKDNPTLNVDLIVHEEGAGQPHSYELKPAGLTETHLSERKISEEDFFGLYLSYKAELPQGSRKVARGWISSEECRRELRSRDISQILVYGTSILKGQILHDYKDRILNLHLGLSPYYRGSGTNYFPFVNKEPEYCGATIMYLDAGIDTGPIIHQLRPRINVSDTFHQISNRFLIDAFKTYMRIGEINLVLQEPLPSCSTFTSCSNQKRLLYKRKDFTESSVKQLRGNFQTSMITDYLDEYSQRNCQVPIVTYSEGDWK